MSESSPEKRVNSGGQAADQAASRQGLELGWLGAWVTVLAIAIWLSDLTPIWLLIAAAGSAVWSWAAVRRRRSYRLGSAALLWLAIGIAGGIQYRLDEVATDWDDLLLRVEESSADALGEALDGLLEEGENAVAGAVEAAERLPAGTGLFAALQDLQQNTNVSAIALFDRSGSAVAWAGEHRGLVPDSVRDGSLPYVFNEGPLFSYLYFTRPLPGGVTVAAAFLLESNVATGDDLLPFAESFEDRHGALPRFWTPDRARGDAVWDWATDVPILSVSFAELTEQHWWERIVTSGRRAVSGIGLLALLALCFGWYRYRVGAAGVPVLVGMTALLVMPIAAVIPAQSLFSPLQFVLPGPLDITLGVLLILIAGAALALLTGSSSDHSLRIPMRLSAGLAFALFPLVLVLVKESAATGMLTADPAGGLPLQIATALAISLPLYILFRHTPPAKTDSRTGRAVAYLLPGVFAVGILLFWSPSDELHFWIAALWGVPATLLLLFRPRLPSLGSGLRMWLAAGWLAGTAALAFLWPLHVQAELTLAERDVSTLGTRTDSFLDFLLRQFARGAVALGEEGETGVNLLYHSWVQSGLAREGYEARISLWDNGTLDTELNLSQLPELPASVRGEVQRVPPQPEVLHYAGADGLNYLLKAPLAANRTITVAVPPRRRTDAPTALASVIHPEQRTPAVGTETLSLVPVDSGTLAADHLALPRADTVQWVRTDRGWRSEALVEMPEGLMHAHLEVATPALPLLMVRAMLLQAAILLTMTLLWILARAICQELAAAPVVIGSWLRSFRGRVSVSLFAFFLLPTVVFGAVSYGAVAREVVRSAAALAQQALDQAAARIPGSPLGAVGDAVRADLLLYEDGTLAGATAPEVIDLGIFPAWLPPSVYLRLTGGDEMQRLEERRLAQSEYLVAYRRLDPGSVLAAPIPLASNEITRRQQEFRDVALFVTLLGLGLSIVLALLVGRALSRPIDELSRAALTVGAGNLRTRLPQNRSDEFGSVYTSFNRMVDRLRRTRAALVRETRRTETIVAEAATGVLALDQQGRVELINPRAAEILGVEMNAGDPLVNAEGRSDAFSDALAELWRSRTAEAGAEVELDGRVIRLKLRRLSGADGGGGAVVALEDMTAEVRTARVLAWGEMARQVAHEIKNPLTPIKLAVQHVRRAYLDERPDFGAILDRNVEAILREIDRLGEIARAFSRFGTPAAASAELEQVDLERTIAETLTLYGGPGEKSAFRMERPATDLPPVIARSDELKEVLLNLLENAREAVVNGGEVVVSAGDSNRPGWVYLAVSDTGSGIPADQLPRIFEPHFSTRSSGTGLGLAIVRRLVDSWGAEIKAESAAGRGTRIEILLRSTDETAQLHTGT